MNFLNNITRLRKQLLLLPILLFSVGMAQAANVFVRLSKSNVEITLNEGDGYAELATALAEEGVVLQFNDYGSNWTDMAFKQYLITSAYDRTVSYKDGKSIANVFGTVDFTEGTQTLTLSEVTSSVTVSGSYLSSSYSFYLRDGQSSSIRLTVVAAPKEATIALKSISFTQGEEVPALTATNCLEVTDEDGESVAIPAGLANQVVGELAGEYTAPGEYSYTLSEAGIALIVAAFSAYDVEIAEGLSGDYTILAPMPKLTVTLQPITHVYDGTVHVLTGKNLVCTNAEGKGVDSPVVSLTPNIHYTFEGGGPSSNVGNYLYILTPVGKDLIKAAFPTYSVEFTESAAYTITQKALSLVFGNLNGVYGNVDNTNPTIINASNVKLAAGSALVTGQTIESLMGNAVFTITSPALSTPNLADAGTYTYYFSTATGAAAFNEIFSNYAVEYTVETALGDYILAKAKATITTLSASSKIYGESNPTFQFSIKGITSTETFAYNKAGLAAAGLFVGGFELEPVLLVKQNNETKTENEKLPVGNYSLVIGNIPVSKNYEFTTFNNDGKFSVTQRLLTFSKLYIKRTHYGDEPANDKYYWLFNADAQPSGLTSFDKAALSKEVINGSTYYLMPIDNSIIDVMPSIGLSREGERSLGAGEHTDMNLFQVKTGKAEDWNYDVKEGDLFANNGLDYTNIKIVVGQAPLKITLDPITIAYGDLVPDLNDVTFQSTFITYEGFKFNEGETFTEEFFIEEGVNRINTLEIRGRDNYGDYLPAGEYEIEGILAIHSESKNYDITIDSSKLKFYVEKCTEEPVIVWDPVNTALIKGNVVQMSAKAFLKEIELHEDLVLFKTNVDKSIAEVKIHQPEGKWYVHVNEIPQGGKLEITAFVKESANFVAGELMIPFTVEDRKNDIDMTVEIVKHVFVYDGTPKEVEFKLYDPTGNNELEKTFVQYNSAYGFPPTDAGDYTYSIYGRKKGSESDFLIHSEKMRIEKAPVKVTATVDKTSVVYGAAQPKLGYTTEGLLGDDDFYAKDAPVVSLDNTYGDAGTYEVIVSGPATLDGNYAITYVSTTFVVEKSPLILMAKPETGVYGDPVPEFQVTTWKSNFVNGDTFEDLAYLYYVNAIGVGEKPNAGEYTLRVDGKSKYDKNYAISYKDTTYVVAKAETVIKYLDNPTTIAKGDVVDLQFESNNEGGAITVKVTGSTAKDVVLVENVKGVWKITANALGQATVVVEQTESLNYKAGKSTTFTFTVVNDLSGIEDANATSVALYPTLVESFVTLEAPAAVKNVSVVDLTGKTNLTINNPVSQLDLSKLNRGHHIVVITLEDGTKHTVRILKK